MNDGGLIAIFVQNLPVLVVVIPLLLAPILAIITAPRVAWAMTRRSRRSERALPPPLAPAAGEAAAREAAWRAA